MEKKDYPQDPLTRCQMRWANLFFGVWQCLLNKDPVLVRGLHAALKREGLYLSKAVEEGAPDYIFAMNPSDEILERSERFKERGIIPKLRRGKGKETTPSYNALEEYSYLVFLLKDLRKKLKALPKKRDPSYKLTMKRMMLKERLERFRERYKGLYSFYHKKEGDPWKDISDERLTELCKFDKGPKELALEILADLYENITPEGVDKLLDKARKELLKNFPKIKEIWEKDGLEFIESE